MMKDYIKILCITASIQITGFLMMHICDILLAYKDSSSAFPAFIFVIGIVISTIVGITMAIKKGKTLKQRLLMIFLMPTNYTWLVCVITFVSIVKSILDIITDLSRNFG